MLLLPMSLSIETGALRIDVHQKRALIFALAASLSRSRNRSALTG